jgi:VanZ family protein
MNSIKSKIPVIFYWLLLMTYLYLMFFGSSSKIPETIQFIPDYILHTIEYMLLGSLFYFSFKSTFKMNPAKMAILIVFIGIFVGLTDEFIQSFTPTRDCSLRDLMVDLIALTLSQTALYYLHKAGILNFLLNKKNEQIS